MRAFCEGLLYSRDPDGEHVRCTPIKFMHNVCCSGEVFELYRAAAVAVPLEPWKSLMELLFGRQLGKNCETTRALTMSELYQVLSLH